MPLHWLPAGVWGGMNGVTGKIVRMPKMHAIRCTHVLLHCSATGLRANSSHERATYLGQKGKLLRGGGHRAVSSSTISAVHSASSGGFSAKSIVRNQSSVRRRHITHRTTADRGRRLVRGVDGCETHVIHHHTTYNRGWVILGRTNGMHPSDSTSRCSSAGSQKAK
jgi:hypothetical protein